MQKMTYINRMTEYGLKHNLLRHKDVILLSITGKCSIKEKENANLENT